MADELDKYSLTPPKDYIHIPGDPNKVISVRQNNIGNIKYANLPGQVGEGDQGFAVYDNPKEGFKGLLHLLDSYKQSHPNMTLAKAADKYYRNPDLSDENVSSYVKDISNISGVSPDTPINKIPTPKLGVAFAKRESSTVVPEALAEELHQEVKKPDLSKYSLAPPKAEDIAKYSLEAPKPQTDLMASGLEGIGDLGVDQAQAHVLEAPSGGKLVAPSPRMGSEDIQQGMKDLLSGKTVKDIIDIPHEYLSKPLGKLLSKIAPEGEKFPETDKAMRAFAPEGERPYPTQREAIAGMSPTLFDLATYPAAGKVLGAGLGLVSKAFPGVEVASPEMVAASKGIASYIKDKPISEEEVAAALGPVAKGKVPDVPPVRPISLEETNPKSSSRALELLRPLNNSKRSLLR